MAHFDHNLSQTSLRTASRLSPSHTRSNPSRTSSQPRPSQPMNINPPSPRSPRRHHKPRPCRQAPPTLPTLPRFHPANFPGYVQSNSSPSASSNTKSVDPHVTNPSLSPRTTRQSQLTDAQRQLYAYHRELFSLNRSASPNYSGLNISRPASPHLEPIASPGAVTPLELEEADQSEGYLVKTSAASGKSDVVDACIRREVNGEAGIRLPQ